MSEPRHLIYRLGLQLTNHVVLYATSAGITFAIALVNLAVLTRFLSLDEFGLLAVLMVFAALLTIVYNLVSLQGTFALVYRGGGEDEIAVEDEDEGTAPQGDKRRILTTGLLLTFAISVAGTVLTCLAAGSLTHVLGDVPASWVRMAAFSGAAGAVWRFAINVLRFERRPGSFVALSALRPIAVLGLSVPLVIEGHGVEGVLFATAVGTLLACLVVLAVSAHSYALGIDLPVLRSIGKRGTYLVPVIVAFWVVHNVDLYLVSVFAEESDTAQYRVAARIAAGMSYFVSAFLMAWMPLSRTLVHQAVESRHGSAATAGTMILYYWATALWAVLGLALLSDALVKVAPATYGPAAPLIPIVAAGFVAYGVFIVLHRTVVVPRKSRMYIWLAALAAVLFLAAGLILVPIYGAYGAAVAPIIGFGLVAAIQLYLSQRGEQPLDLPFVRLAAITLVLALTLAFGYAAGEISEEMRLLVAVVLVITFPLLLARLGLVEIPSLGELRAVGRRAREAPFRERIPGLDSPEWELAGRLLRDGDTASDVARDRGSSEEEMLTGFSQLVEGVAAQLLPPEVRVEAARYLLMKGPTAIVDDAGARLVAAGVEPLTLIDLETARDVVGRELGGRRRGDPSMSLAIAGGPSSG